MGVLATLRQNKAGEWPSLLEYLRELRHRETGAVGALGSVLGADHGEQRELGEAADAGPILLEVACDLRVPKGARLAAARCLLEAGIDAPHVGHLFIGAGDLVTDPRLGGAARDLIERGLPAAVALGGEPANVSLAAGAFARAAHAAASAAGPDRVQQLLAQGPEGHAGISAALFALGARDPPEKERALWAALLRETCERHRRAPAAALRIGLVPPWPPNLPDAFAPMLREAETKSEGVKAKDAATDPGSIVKPRKGAPGQTLPAPVAPSSPAARKMAPPIRRAAPRAATVEELPRTTLPPKAMQEVRGRAPAGNPSGTQRARVEAPGSAAQKPIPPAIAAQLAPRADVRFDARGRRIPRSDRWDDDAFGWPEPILPSPELPRAPRARVAPGPFAARLRSLFDDRPEAVDRLCAAAEARAALRGEAEAMAELRREIDSGRWQGRRAPEAQLARLRSVAMQCAHPATWQAVACVLLERFSVPESANQRSG